MGMRDESWCGSCGTSLPYSEEEVQCGECAEYWTNRSPKKLIQVIEYMKIHLISLEQDYDKCPTGDRDSVLHLNGQVLATTHLLSVANDILSYNPEER